MEQYKIYNKDSRHLREIKDTTIDLVVTSPPFNIAHRYKTYHDSLEYKEFDALYSTVINSISRVLKDDGFFIIDIADIIVMEDIIIYGAEFIKEKALSANLNYMCSFPYIAIEGADVKMKSCISRKDNAQKFHSLCEQIIVFGKSHSHGDIAHSIHIAPSYTYSPKYDTAFWPESLVKDIIAPFELNDKLLLDPFMGSGTIGRIAIEQGGRFIGYDIDTETLTNYGWL